MCFSDVKSLVLRSDMKSQYFENASKVSLYADIVCVCVSYLASEIQQQNPENKLNK